MTSINWEIVGVYLGHGTNVFTQPLQSNGLVIPITLSVQVMLDNKPRRKALKKKINRKFYTHKNNHQEQQDCQQKLKQEELLQPEQQKQQQLDQLQDLNNNTVN